MGRENKQKTARIRRTKDGYERMVRIVLGRYEFETTEIPAAPE